MSFYYSLYLNENFTEVQRRNFSITILVLRLLEKKSHGLGSWAFWGLLNFLFLLGFQNSSSSEYGLLEQQNVLITHILSDYSDFSELLSLRNCWTARLYSAQPASPCCNGNSIFRNDARFLIEGRISFPIPQFYFSFSNITFYASKSPGQLKNLLQQGQQS